MIAHFDIDHPILYNTTTNEKNKHVPNCTTTHNEEDEEGHIITGCVPIPKSISIHSHSPLPPLFSGQLYTKPPSCKGRKCFSNHPISSIETKIISNDMITEGLTSVSPFDYTFDDIPVNLPGMDTNWTVAVAIADFNNDGFMDIIYGSFDFNDDFGGLLLLMNNGGQKESMKRSFQDPIRLSTKAALTVSLFTADINNDGWVDIIVGNNGRLNEIYMNKGVTTDSISTNDRPLALFEEDPIELPTTSVKMRSSSIFVADINNDGWLDIIVGINGKGERSELLMNKNRGMFPEVTPLPHGSSSSNGSNGSLSLSRTKSIFVSDFNNDGFADIVFGNAEQSNEILFNDGYGRFNEGDVVTLPGGSTTTKAISALDVDNDGNLDLIFGNFGVEELLGEPNQLLQNLGNGSFGEALNLTNDDFTESVSVADVNNDGVIDIVFGNQLQSNKILIHSGIYGNFKEAFQQDAIDIPSDGQDFTTALAVADIDNDGMVDYVIANYKESSQVYFTSTNGRFQHPINLKGQKESKAVAIGDFNSDGYLDIVVGNGGAGVGKNELLFNLGNDKFASALTLPKNETSDAQISSVAVADINNDGNLDIIFGYSGKSNELLLNQGNGTFYDPLLLPGNATSVTTTLAVADVDKDGWVDIIVGNDGSTNQILFNTGSSDFFTKAIPLDPEDSGVSTLSIAAADVNNDRQIDIIVGNDQHARNQLFLYSHLDSEGLIVWNETSIPGDDLDSRVIEVADMNNDGAIDIVVGNYKEHNQILFNDGKGNFTEIETLPGGQSSTTSLVCADINHDGNIDIVIGNSVDGNYLLVNNGQGNYKYETVTRRGARGSAIAIGDLNADGYIDLVLANNGADNIYIPYSVCPDGGSLLHSKSWCFRCPSFMGQVTSSSSSVAKRSVCRECPPDYQQQGGIGEQCDVYKPCFLGERKLGDDNCVGCPDGTFYNSTLSREEEDPVTWDLPRCVSCPEGHYANKSQPAINLCDKCPPGYSQNKSGSPDCNRCPIGEFQPEFGSLSCKECAMGGYCDSLDSSDGGFQRCPQGTYNDKVGKSDKSDCIKCPPGTYNVKIGSTSSEDCLPCSPGTYSAELG